MNLSTVICMQEKIKIISDLRVILCNVLVHNNYNQYERRYTKERTLFLLTYARCLFDFYDTHPCVYNQILESAIVLYCTVLYCTCHSTCDKMLSTCSNIKCTYSSLKRMYSNPKCVHINKNKVYVLV